MASGVAPTGAATTQLAVLAATVGALEATVARASDPRVLLVLLGSGQLLGHVLLGAVGHDHSPATAPPGAAMPAAHLVAVAAGAALIAACDRLCGALSRAVRAVCAGWPAARSPWRRLPLRRRC